MKQILGVIVAVLVTVVLVVLGLTLRQVNQRQLQLANDLQIRTALLADSFKESIRPHYLAKSTKSLQKELNKFTGRDRLLGLAVYDNKGGLFAASTGLSAELTGYGDISQQAMDADAAIGEFFVANGEKIFILATPLRRNEEVMGALVVFQKADFVDAAINQIWRNNLIGMFIQALLLSLALTLILRWIIFQPIMKLTESIRRASSGKKINEPDILKNHTFLRPVTAEISKMSRSLIKAQIAAREEARLRLEKLDSPWTAERLKEFIKAYLKGRQIYIVSNSEPYVHYKKRNKIEYLVPAGGVVTALEPIMEACGGTWLAHGSGDGDRLVVDKDDKIAVPPGDPQYSLKRLWLTDDEVKGYYLGFSNQALWPLCHGAHVRPTFRQDHWTEYKKVNGKFAQGLLAEIKDIQRPIILIQDYHLALLPEMIKTSRPDADVGIFWHIPWPSGEAFGICPWRKELLKSILGADLIGFHTQQYCNNFLETVGREIESIVDLETFSVTHKGHTAQIKPFPISVAFANESDGSSDDKSDFLDKLGIKTEFLGIGVDRMDYTKGILERLKGVEFFFDNNPSYIGRFTFLQIASPSREGVEKYRQFRREVIKESDRINNKFTREGWIPIVLLNKHHSHDEIYSLFRSADLCMVTSLSDGMNLVAKEYVAARNDNAGVLVLSQFTGAARDLKEAIIVNPYSAEQTGEAIYSALNMPKNQQFIKMKKMRASVMNYNVYRWAAEFIKAATDLG